MKVLLLIYCKAWENNFDNNPMTAILGELQTLTKTNDALFKKIIHAAALITKNALPVIVKGVVSRYVDSDALVNIATDSSKGSGEILEKR